MGAAPLPVLANFGGGEEARRSSPLALAVRTFADNPLAVAGLVYFVLLVLFCFLGPFAYHTNQTSIDQSAVNLAPSMRHPLGTDNTGFDILGRLMLGGQSSIEIALAAAVVANVFGAIYGALAAIAGGALDALLMRVLDGLYALPGLFILIILSDVFSPDALMLILLLAFFAWLGPARLVRGEALSLRRREYVEAAQMSGGRWLRVILRHIVPNTLGTLIVNTTFQVVDAILILATLSFLGFGLPPTYPSWGAMLSNGITYLYDGYWWQIYPVLAAITLTVLAVNFVGDGLREAFDARLRRG